MMDTPTPTVDTADRRDAFDRLLGALQGLPDVTESRPATIQTIQPLLGTSQTYIIRTWRQIDRGGDKATRGLDTIFIECVSAAGSFRIALPPKVADAIARQRDALSAKTRSKAARANAAERKRGTK
jgi:hypothetical protein